MKTKNPPTLKLAKQERDEIALRICREIDASNDAKGSLPKRWRVNEDIYHVAPGITNLNVIEGMEAYNIPLWRPKADRIKGSLVAALTGVFPNVQILTEGPQSENVEELERTLMSIADYARFNEALDKNIIDALNTNIGVSRVRPIEKRGGMCVLIDWVHPVNMPVGTIQAQNPSAWVASPNLHDGSAGDTSTGYRTGSQGASTARMAVLTAKAAGMPVESVDIQAGYANGGAFDTPIGAQSITGPWSLISFGSATNSPTHFGTFSYSQMGVGDGPGTPCRYLATIVEDAGGGNNEAGCADIRWRAGGIDIGPP